MSDPKPIPLIDMQDLTCRPDTTAASVEAENIREAILRDSLKYHDERARQWEEEPARGSHALMAEEILRLRARVAELEAALASIRDGAQTAKQRGGGTAEARWAGTPWEAPLLLDRLDEIELTARRALEGEGK